MKDGNLKVGMWCRGRTSVNSDIGKIKAIERSTGSRKDLIYNIGLSWYFADQIQRHWEGDIEELIPKGCRIVFKNKVHLTNNAIEYDVLSIVHDNNFVVNVKGASRRDKDKRLALNLYSLRETTLRGLHHSIMKELGKNEG